MYDPQFSQFLFSSPSTIAFNVNKSNYVKDRSNFHTNSISWAYNVFSSTPHRFAKGPSKEVVIIID